ncbi:MAG: hypothetical protein ACM3ZT_05060 [Bacillota bacterium]
MITNPATNVPDSGWPVIQPLHAEYAYVRPDKPGEDAPYLVYFLDPKGNKVYRFECHRGGYHDDGYGVDFTGDFQCMLFPFKGETVSAVNLLAADTHEEQKDDWHNRGRILAKQLQGECLNYPEYSNLRHFVLRGMDVTLAIKDPAWEQGGKGRVLAKFTLVLDAVPDVNAKTAMAETAAGDRPPGDCYPGTKTGGTR